MRALLTTIGLIIIMTFIKVSFADESFIDIDRVFPIVFYAPKK